MTKSPFDQYKEGLSTLLSNLPEELIRPTIRYLGRTDLWFLLRHLLNRKDIDHPWLWDRCREVQNGPNGFLDLWARYHFKSTIITFAKSIQDILASHGEDPLPEWNGREVTIGIFSHNRPMAKDFLRQIKREFEDNFKLQLYYPDILYEHPESESPKWSEDMGLIVKRQSNPKEATVEAHGVVEGQPTGKHYFIRIYDDMVADKYVTTPEMIKKTTDSWAMSTSLCDPAGYARYIGTRYHLRDTYHEMMERKAAIPRLHPATDNGEPDGVPVLIPAAKLQEERDNKGPYMFSCQFLLNPIGDKAQCFKKEWIVHYDYTPRVRQNMNVYIIVDPASGKKKHSDYTVFWVVGLSSDGNYYHLELRRDRMSLTKKAETMMELHRKWKPLGVGYEQYGMQADIQHIQYIQKEQNYRFHITEMGGKVAKADRIKKLMPIFEKKKFYLQENEYHVNYEGQNCDVIAEFLREEYLAFPVGAHDDMLDCLARILDPDLNAIWPDGSSAVSNVDTSRRSGYKPKKVAGSAWAV